MSLTKSKNTWSGSDISTEQTTSEVITKPNQSQSIREILFRNTQGMTYDNYKTPYYEDQATFSSKSINVIQDMEPTEKMQFLTEIRAEAQALKNKIQADETAKAQAIADAQAEEQAQASDTGSSPK